jgi:predicted nucleic acid-binding Zn ribbon protein
MKERTCPICEATLVGRSDKKFCSVKCKSIHQYENRQKSEVFFLQVDRQLKINRKILKRYNKSGYTTIRRSILTDVGFDPKFFTHYWKNNKGNVYLFVYEYGFLKIAGQEKYLLVIWQEYMTPGIRD